jgi:hypothetical protein
MKRVVLLGSFLVVFCASPGTAAAQSLDGLTDPLKDGVDTVTEPVEKVKEVVDKVKEPAEEALPSPKEPVHDAGKAVDKVVKDVTDVAANPSGIAKTPTGGGSDAPSLAPSTGSGPASGNARTEQAATGASARRTTVARTSSGSAEISKGARRAAPAGDTQQVAAAGNMIESGEVKGAQTVAPATDGDEGGGSSLSLTGVQILTLLIAACGLMAAGIAFNLTGRLRLRAARS